MFRDGDVVFCFLFLGFVVTIPTAIRLFYLPSAPTLLSPHRFVPKERQRCASFRDDSQRVSDGVVGG